MITASRPKGLGRLAGWLAVSYLPAVVGAPFPAPDWYRGLRKPSWAPPGWLFAPVWTVLYGLMGVAAWSADRDAPDRSSAGQARGLFGVQLLLNAAWTPLFFGLRRPGIALAEIVAMWVAILATIITFWRARARAGVLLLPYLAWVSFATILNAAIWRRNR